MQPAHTPAVTIVPTACRGADAQGEGSPSPRPARGHQEDRGVPGRPQPPSLPALCVLLEPRPLSAASLCSGSEVTAGAWVSVCGATGYCRRPVPEVPGAASNTRESPCVAWSPAQLGSGPLPAPFHPGFNPCLSLHGLLSTVPHPWPLSWAMLGAMDGVRVPGLPAHVSRAPSLWL